jgi:hypothetical protein
VGKIKKKKKIIILNDRLFYFLSTAIVILIVIVIAIKHYEIEHVFLILFHYAFFLPELSSIHAFVLHTNGLKVDVDYIPELDFFFSRYWEQIS